MIDTMLCQIDIIDLALRIRKRCIDRQSAFAKQVELSSRGVTRDGSFPSYLSGG